MGHILCNILCQSLSGLYDTLEIVQIYVIYVSNTITNNKLNRTIAPSGRGRGASFSCYIDCK